MKKKMLLIHGWNYLNYSSLTSETDAWHNREEMVRELEKNYIVYKINLPGFCHQEEPDCKEWDLEDFAQYIENYLISKHLKIDYVLGYSFGGAVAVTWKNLFHHDAKLILVSPALIRNFKHSKSFLKTPSFMKKIRNKIRDWYLINIVKTNEMVYGTTFLRNTYQIIVRKELMEEVKKINPNELMIIYGDKDDMVLPLKFYESMDDLYKKRIFFIPDGGHNIGKTNYMEICKLIVSF